MSNKNKLDAKNTRLEQCNQELKEIYSTMKNKLPNGTITIIENGDYDVAAYKSAHIDVPSFEEGEAVGNALADSIVERTITTFSNHRISKIGSYAFARHAGLKTIDIPNVTHIDLYGFNYCTGLTEIELPKVERIESQSFNSCSKLSRLDAPVLNYIGAHSMTASGLTQLILRNTETVCTLQNAAAIDMTPIAKREGYIYVPDDLVKTYRDATNWSTYATQIRKLSELDTEIIIPEEYQKVKYIESTGTQYIDTGTKLNENSSLIISFKPTSATSGAIFGSRTSATENNFSVLLSGEASNPTVVADFNNYQLNRLQTAATLNAMHVVEMNKTEIRINADVHKITDFAVFTTPANAYLFGGSGSMPWNTKASIQLYECKLYQEEALIRHFIPCYRKEDGVIGLYDLVENKFYQNNGTESFIKGQDI